MTKPQQLPIDAIFEPFKVAITEASQIIIHAPPGAGKSTRLPLWLLQRNEPAKKNDKSKPQKIYLIQPRRLAASNVAAYLAGQLNEALGQQVGLIIRGESKMSKSTRLVVMTEGVFVRLLQEDPELTDVAWVIFDEFHERSWQLDLGLALSLEVQQAYRDDDKPLQLIIMSATLAVDPLCKALPDARLLQSEGRCYPVDLSYCAMGLKDDLASVTASVVKRSIKDNQGSVLVFLPGMREIRRVESLLNESGLPEEVSVYPLHGSLSKQQQRSAIETPAEGLRKVVLATNVAETSITIDGVRVVIDSGFANVAQFDGRKGMSQLVRQRISKASAEQRMGRAGRTAPGVCYRLWSKEGHASLYDFDKPAIQRDDITPLLLELAYWGESDLTQLTLLDLPTDKALQQGKLLLQDLEAVNKQGVISAKGKAMSRLGLHPRVAALCWEANGQSCMPEAALLATLLTESAAMGSQRSSDLSFLFNDFCRIVKGEGYQRVAQSTAKRILKLSSQLLSRLEGKSALRQMTAKGERAVWGCLLSAFPDHLAKQRGETSNRYLLANGHEVQLHQQDSLQGLPWLLVIDASTSQQSKQLPFVRQAVALAESQAMAFMSSRIREQVSLIWDGGAGAFRATQQKRYGKIVLSERQIKPNVQELKQAVLDYVQEQGLAIMNDQAYRQLAARVDWLSRHTSSELPDFSESTLLRQVHDWLALYINNVKTKADLARIDVASILWAQLDWSQQRLLDEKVPVSLKLPTGSNRQIDYHRLDKPVVSARMQEFYGLQQTPTIGDGFPLLVELLSPAQRPMQLTNDLPGFWAGSYREVAKEMRGRYPRHFWPEDPAKAKATATTKKKMS